MSMCRTGFYTSIHRLGRINTRVVASGEIKCTKNGVVNSCNNTKTLSPRDNLLKGLQQYIPVSFYSVSSIVGKDLPYHIVVGLPALSPTMDMGTLSEWYVKEGDSFSAGDGIAKIETDKAAMDFEAQDDGYVAKILLNAGQGSDLAVGTPIMITVEDANDVEAFKDYVHQSEVVVAAPTPEPAPVKAVSPTPPPPPTPAVTPAAPSPVVVAASAPPTPSPVVTVASPVTTTSTNFSTAYGLSVSKTSPLAKTLAAQQKTYIEKYGTTGQSPIL